MSIFASILRTAYKLSGKLLEVPVGTGILTMPVYQTMPEADGLVCPACL